MVPKGFEPNNNATKIKISYNGPILGKKKKVDGLNSSKEDLQQIKKKKEIRIIKKKGKDPLNHWILPHEGHDLEC